MNNMTYSACDTQECEHISAAKYSATIMDQMNCLYLLSYLVTADRQVAEHCLTRALAEYVEGQIGFLAWAENEGRLAVLRQAIRSVRPVLKQVRWLNCSEMMPSVATAHQPFAVITSLSPFERFAFVMCTIENLPEDDSAGLLNCTVEDLALGHEVARQIIAMQDDEVVGDIPPFVVPTLLGNQVCGVC
jgi:hypothetical protein